MIFYLLWKGGGAGEAQDARGSTKSGKWSGESREDKSEDRGSERGIVEINSSEGQKKKGPGNTVTTACYAIGFGSQAIWKSAE